MSLSRSNPTIKFQVDEILWGLASVGITGFGVYCILKATTGKAPDTITTAGDTASLASLSTLIL